MSRVDEITIEGATITLLATQNGRARVPVFVIDRWNRELRFTHSINPANLNERQRFIEQLPSEVSRDEVGELFQQLAMAIQLHLLERTAEATPSPFEPVEPWPDPVDGSELLAALEHQILS